MIQRSYVLVNIDNLGRRVLKRIEYSFHIFLMVYVAIRDGFKDNAHSFRSIFSVVSAQIYFTGFQALPLVSLLAIASGGLVIVQSTSQLSLLGGSNMVGPLLIAVIIRELGPLMTALIVVARSGTAVATELGNMRVNRETEALEILGINPMSYVIFPRLVGGIISVVTLAFYFNVIALMGGFAVTQFFQNIPFSYFIMSLAQAFKMEDFWIFLIKNMFSGAIIFTVSCYQGFKVTTSPHEVPQVTTRAVVDSILYVVGFNILVTLLSYLNKLTYLGVL